eukprot:scaffold37353_cov65-Phaeocystis_antarctica.AAC.10
MVSPSSPRLRSRLTSTVRSSGASGRYPATVRSSAAQGRVHGEISSGTSRSVSVWAPQSVSVRGEAGQEGEGVQRRMGERPWR